MREPGQRPEATTIAGSPNGRARDFDSRGVGSSPAPATNGIIA